ncbi:MAG: 16S rRNA (cytosine(1402)-N(4))-methyltransferase RsmH [Cyclobacteriaceae bacterium]
MYHKPVLLSESVKALLVKDEGIYVDLTFGGGGHSMAILEHLKNGRLYAFDQDPDAETNASRFLSKSFQFVKGNFRHFKKYLKMYGVDKVDGILADLGISSHQIDEPERGFSTRFDAKLDMRMDPTLTLTARKVLSKYSEEELHRILGMYGEIRNAKTLAAAIVFERTKKPLNTVNELKELLEKYAPKRSEFKYYAQVFQALRIEVNEELEALKEMLHTSGDVLNPGGRLVVISYHSLEDRLVKNYINKGRFHGDVEKDFYGNEIKPLKAVTRKPVIPSDEEIAENNRARSARMRIAEKI